MATAQKPTAPVRHTHSDPAAAAPVQHTHSDPAASTKGVKIVAGFRFTKKKTVTVPVLKLIPGAPAFVRAEAAMFIGKKIDSGKGKDMEPATLLPVIDLTTGEEAQIIVGTALKGIINETYPDNSYVGKNFEITSKGKLGDKKYNTYTVIEVDVDEA